MAGFSSLDDLLKKMTTDGQFLRVDWNKNFGAFAAVSGEWHCMARGAGNPAADTIFNTGTNLLFQQLKDTTTNMTGIQHGGNVSPNYKHVVNASAFSGSSGAAPGVAMLVDLLGFYRVSSVTTTTAQTLTNTLIPFSDFTADAGTDTLTHTNINLMPNSKIRVSTTGSLPSGLASATDYFVIKVTDLTCKLATTYANAVAGVSIDIVSSGSGTHTIQNLLPRYTNGAGVQSFIFSTVNLGSASPNLSLSYTNSQSVAGRATPGTLPLGKASSYQGHIVYSGSGSGKYGPSMPLQAGDSGVSSVETVQNSSSYVSGEYAVVLYKPLLTLPITATGIASERDLVNQLPSLPRVYDGACLTWLWFAGTTTPSNSSFVGHIDFAWG